MLDRFFFRRSGSLDPYYNLAEEEYMLNHIGENACILFLYQNAHTVVIGKNQNPWRECRLAPFEAEGGRLARRISGGGAVYHDLGNLNFSFILDKNAYDVQKQLSVIVRAVNDLGIAAEPTGRNDITVGGRKFSGNAFCFRKNGAFHHGTILVSSDISLLSRYLQVSPEKITQKGITSVPSRVVNLMELKPAVTLENVCDALYAAFVEVYGPPAAYAPPPSGLEEIAELVRRNTSAEWKYGHSPRFDIAFETRFAWGGVELCLEIKNACVTSASVYSDAIFTGFADALRENLKGCAFNAHALYEKTLSTPVSEEERPLIRDIAQFLLQKEL